MKKTTRQVFVSAVTLMLTLVPVLVQAHHAFAMFETDQDLNFTGKLLRFIPGANHAQILFEVVDNQGNVVMEDGKPLVWGFETGGSAMIARMGVTVRDFPTGSFINVSLSPSRNGKPFGVQSGPIVKCGMELPAAGCNVDTGEVFMGEHYRPD